MTLGTQAKVWAAILAVFVLVLVVLKGILLPFVAGMAIAYLLDPTCDRLERLGCSRNLATVIVTAVFAVVVILFLLLIVPLAVQEAVNFLSSLPDFISRTQDRLMPYVAELQQRLNLPDAAEMSQLARGRFGTARSWLGGALQSVVGQGLALANLLQNAFKFCAPCTDAQIRVSARTEGGDTVIEVHDNGVGFDPQRAGELFQPFVRLHSPGIFPGTGIGLATVDRIMRRHGGRAQAHSSSGKGTCFSLHFPAGA